MAQVDPSGAPNGSAEVNASSANDFSGVKTMEPSPSEIEPFTTKNDTTITNFGDRNDNERETTVPDGFVEIDGKLVIVPDVNAYQQRKSAAQGMLDIALFTANVNQLRYVVECYASHPYHYISIVLISLSLIIQVAVGIGLILNVQFNVKDPKEICRANKINNLTVLAVFLITTINVLISSFGVANPPEGFAL